MGSGTTKQKATDALNAMRAIGISKHTAKPVLKNLLKLYDNNWEYIEAENYRVLADAIFDMQESKASSPFFLFVLSLAVDDSFFFDDNCFFKNFLLFQVGWKKIGDDVR